jgi:DNA-binding IclR family transcriptional regulator
MPDHDELDDSGAESPESRPQRGIQSIEVGGQVLRAMAHSGRPMALKDLAREADMPAAKIHPYLVSFARIGLMEQDAESGRYFLGPLALQLGLISLKQANPVQAAAAELPELVQRIGHTVAIAVWGSRGATIVRLEESPAPIHVNMRQGTVFSVAGTATGRLFAAYRAVGEVKALLDDERRRQKSHPAPPIANVPPARAVPAWREFEQALREVREHGLARSDGETLPGVNAIAAPVFDHEGRIVLAVTAIGPASIFDLAWDGAIAWEVRACAARISRRLGAPVPDVVRN